MIKYYCSDGTRVSQETINRKRGEAYASKYAGITSILPCGGCGGKSIDNDHTIAQARCKILHKTELIWNKLNFVRSCRKCHREWENFKSGNWILHANSVERLEFLKEHDPEGYRIRIELTTAALNEEMNKISKKKIDILKS